MGTSGRQWSSVIIISGGKGKRRGEAGRWGWAHLDGIDRRVGRCERDGEGGAHAALAKDRFGEPAAHVAAPAAAAAPAGGMLSTARVRHDEVVAHLEQLRAHEIGAEIGAEVKGRCRCRCGEMGWTREIEGWSMASRVGSTLACASTTGERTRRTPPLRAEEPARRSAAMASVSGRRSCRLSASGLC